MSRHPHHRIAIVGASGQLGSELRRLLGDRAIAIRHSQLELSDPTSIRAAFVATNPDFVINAAAYNWVDKAEDEPQAAYAVNALGPRNLALACAERSLPLLHVSSDYVFGLDAGNAPFRETDPPGPLSAYGLSKLAGEYFVRSLCPQHFVIRTCGLYGNAEAVGKGNFVKTMLRLGRERGHVRIVNDQQCTPTSTTDLAAALVQLIETDAFGLYHLTNQGATTWHDFAREVFLAAKLEVTTEPISTREFGAKAPRPAYSVLNCDKAAGVLNVEMPPWQEAVTQYVRSSLEHPGS
ncbi:MAG: dTDP-4-dehydrorhamnose reductase [Planctomycetota bacterium]